MSNFFKKISILFRVVFGEEGATVVAHSLRDAATIIAVTMILILVGVAIDLVSGDGHEISKIVVGFIHEGTYLLATVAISAVTIRRFWNLVIKAYRDDNH